jgi:hypothetical protein
VKRKGKTKGDKKQTKKGECKKNTKPQKNEKGVNKKKKLTKRK